MARTFIRLMFAVVTFTAFSATAHAQNAFPNLGKLWLEAQVSSPEGNGQTGRKLTPLVKTAYTYSEGNYQSVMSRMTIAIPVIRSESLVSVRESIVSRRPDGTPITSHVLFLPGGLGAAPNTNEGVSAIVVTLLRDDRPKDAPSVLSKFEPASEAARKNFAQQGVEYSRVSTNMGDAVQRVVRNRLADDPFPYVIRVKPGEELVSFGVSRYVVAPNDSLIEFSQVIPCTGMLEVDCRQRALVQMQRFVEGVREFLLIANASTQ